MFSGLTDKSSYLQSCFVLYQVGIPFILLIFAFIITEWIGREGQYGIAHLGEKWKRPMRYALYYGIIAILFLYGGGKEQQFIYFQF